MSLPNKSGIEAARIAAPALACDAHIHVIDPAFPPAMPGAAFAAMRRLIDAGRTWVKLSGAYLDTKSGPPAYADVGEVARALVKAAPERLVWGSDWPHVTEPRMPDTAPPVRPPGRLGRRRADTPPHPG